MRDVCAVTNVLTKNHNVIANCSTATLKYVRVPTRATAYGNRVAQMWNLWEAPDSGRATQTLCGVCVATDASTKSRNFIDHC